MSFVNLLFIIALIVILLLALLLRHVRKINRTVDRMKDIVGSELDAKLLAHTQQPEYLDKLYRITGMERGTLPPTRGWAASPDFLLTIAEIILEKKPKVIVELGSGTSTIMIAYLLKKIGEGHLFSYDHSDIFMNITKQNIEKENLSEFVDFNHAPLADIDINATLWRWYSLNNVPEKIDMIIIDGPPGLATKLSRYPAGPALFPHTSDDAIFILDDAKRPDEKEIANLYELEFPNWSQNYMPFEKGILIMTKN